MGRVSPEITIRVPVKAVHYNTTYYEKREGFYTLQFFMNIMLKTGEILRTFLEHDQDQMSENSNIWGPIWENNVFK